MDSTTAVILAFDAGIIAGGVIMAKIAQRVFKRVLDEKIGPAIDRVFEEATGRHGAIAPGNLAARAADFERRYNEAKQAKQWATNPQWAPGHVHGEIQTCNHAGVYSAEDCVFCRARRTQ